MEVTRGFLRLWQFYKLVNAFFCHFPHYFLCSSVVNQCNALQLVSAQSSYTAKVEDLVNIKQKQDADKAVARLHSFKFVS